MSIYALQVRPACEQDAANDLQAHGYPACAPTRIALQRVRGIWTERERLVFPGYAFVDTDLSDAAYRTIKACTGVVRILGFGHPEPLRQHEAAYIRLLAADGKPSTVLMHPDGRYEPQAGILHKLQALGIQHDPRQQRARVTVTLCGHPYHITLAAYYITQ